MKIAKLARWALLTTALLSVAACDGCDDDNPVAPETKCELSRPGPLSIQVHLLGCTETHCRARVQVVPDGATTQWRSLGAEPESPTSNPAEFKWQRPAGSFPFSFPIDVTVCACGPNLTGYAESCRPGTFSVEFTSAQASSNAVKIEIKPEDG